MSDFFYRKRLQSLITAKSSPKEKFFHRYKVIVHCTRCQHFLTVDMVSSENDV